MHACCRTSCDWGQWRRLPTVFQAGWSCHRGPSTVILGSGPVCADPPPSPSPTPPPCRRDRHYRGRQSPSPCLSGARLIPGPAGRGVRTDDDLVGRPAGSKQSHSGLMPPEMWPKLINYKPPKLCQWFQYQLLPYRQHILLTWDLVVGLGQSF